MTLQISYLVDKISQLEIAGVKIRDMDEMQPINTRDCPVLIPEPLGFVSDLIISRDSTGIPSQARKTATYTLNYTFLYRPIGADRQMGLDSYGDMVRKTFAILDAVISEDDLMSGTASDEIVDITPSGIVEFGPVPDPAGGQYLGCRLRFLVTEFIN